MKKDVATELTEDFVVGLCEAFTRLSAKQDMDTIALIQHVLDGGEPPEGASDIVYKVRILQQRLAAAEYELKVANAKLAEVPDAHVIGAIQDILDGVRGAHSNDHELVHRIAALKETRRVTAEERAVLGDMLRRL